LKHSKEESPHAVVRRYQKNNIAHLDSWQIAKQTNKRLSIDVRDVRAPVFTTILTHPRVNFQTGARGGGWMEMLARGAPCISPSQVRPMVAGHSFHASGRGLIESAHDRAVLA
jgi:hypothetical protein